MVPPFQRKSIRVWHQPRATERVPLPWNTPHQKQGQLFALEKPGWDRSQIELNVFYLTDRKQITEIFVDIVKRNNVEEN